MPTLKGDIQSVGTAGWWTTLDSGPGPGTPDAPRLSAADDGTDSSVTASVLGDELAAHHVYWRRLSGGVWALGGSREGNGALAIGGLPAAQVQFVAVSEYGGQYSLPSTPVEVAVGERSGSDAAFIAQEVTDLLNGHDFSQSFTAERTMLPERDLSEMATLRVGQTRTVSPIFTGPYSTITEARRIVSSVPRSASTVIRRIVPVSGSTSKRP